MLQQYAVMVYPKIYSNKAEAAKEMGIVKKRIFDTPMLLTMQEISEMVVSGCTYTFGCGYRLKADDTYKDDNWLQQQIYALDIDNDQTYISVEEAIRLCKKCCLPPAIVYTTANHTKQHNKFRLVFALDEPAMSLDEHVSIMQSLMRIVYDEKQHCTYADTHAIDRSRCFFSGKEVVYLDTEAVISKANLLELADVLSKEDITSGCTHNSRNNLKDNSLDSHNNNVAVTSISNSKEDNTFIVIPLKEFNPYADSKQKLYIYSQDVYDALKQVKQELEEVSHLNLSSLNYLRSQLYQGLEDDVTIMQRYAPNNIYIKEDIYNKKEKSGAYLPAIVKPLAKVPSNPCCIRDFESFVDTVQRKNWNKCFNLPSYGKFSCIFHPDKNPSAEIAAMSTNHYVKYRCFSSKCHKEYYSVFDFIWKVYGVSISTIKRWLSLKYNIDYTTPWLLGKFEQIRLLRDRFVTQLYYMKENYPILHDYMSRGGLIGTYSMFLDAAEVYIYDKSISQSDEIVFYVSTSHLAKMAKRLHIDCSSLSTLHRRIKKLANLGILRCVPDEELSPQLLANLRLKQFQMNAERANDKSKVSHRIECYAIPDYDESLMSYAQHVIQTRDAQGKRSVDECYQSLAIAESGNLTDVYAQNPNKKLKEQKEVLDGFFEAYIKAATKFIKRRGYMTEKEVLAKIPGYTDGERARYGGICLQGLIKKLKLKRVRFTKAFQKKYGIINKRLSGPFAYHYGVTRMIIPEEDEIPPVTDKEKALIGFAKPRKRRRAANKTTKRKK